MPLTFGDEPKKRRELDMAPLIDVVFLLLVFFLLTSSYVFKAFDLKLPAKGKVKPQDTERMEPVSIALTAEGEILFDGIPVTLEDLRRNVYAHLPANGKRTFILKPADASQVQLLVTVMDRVRAAGATDVRMARAASSSDSDAAGAGSGG